jgi:hypothetical protein
MQGLSRRRDAKKRVAQIKFERSPDGIEMTFMALRIQNASRVRKARKEFRLAKEAMLARERESVLGDALKQQVIHGILEDTLDNLRLL